MDPLDQLLDRAPDMSDDALASQILDACEDDDHELIVWAYHVAHALPAERRPALLDSLALDPRRRARVDRMLGICGSGDGDPFGTPVGFDFSSGTWASCVEPPERPFRFARGAYIDGRYQVLAPLGRGGMGEVYVARDRRIKRKVAVKTLTRIGDPEMSARFIREARLTASCRHENIVVVHDVGEHAEPDRPALPYIVLEYLEGASLREHLRAAGESGSAPIPAAQALDLLIPITRALARAHDQGIVHRDLKPENVYVTASGAVVVLDFGIAKSIQTAHGNPSSSDSLSVNLRYDSVDYMHTRADVIMGSAGYMAPEQWGVDPDDADPAVDHRADIWAVGVIAHELLAGAHPIGAGTVRDITDHVCDLERPMPNLADAPGFADNAGPAAAPLAALVARCLAKRPDDRVPDAAALLAALEAAQSVLDSAPSGVGAAPGATARRRVQRALVALVLVLVLVLAVAIGIILAVRAVRGAPTGPDASATAPGL